jgi:hypothetical protein
MKIISIFERSKASLYAVKYEGEDLDALQLLQEKWSDLEELRNFFKKFKQDYESYYGNFSLSKIVEKVINDADELFGKIYALAEDESGKHFSEIFKPLYNKEVGTVYDLQQLKAYGAFSNSFLRIYAVRYRNSIVITGGAIKLTAKMQDRKHTKDELFKLNIVRDYLQEKGDEGEFVYLDI